MLYKTFSEKESHLIQFILRSDVMVMSTNPLKPVETSNSNMKIELPNIYPIHYTISLDKTNFYQTEDIYRKFNTYNMHVAFIISQIYFNDL